MTKYYIINIILCFSYTHIIIGVKMVMENLVLLQFGALDSVLRASTSSQNANWTHFSGDLNTKHPKTEQGTVALWSDASVLHREDGGSNLGLGLFFWRVKRSGEEEGWKLDLFELISLTMRIYIKDCFLTRLKALQIKRQYCSVGDLISWSGVSSC